MIRTCSTCLFWQRNWWELRGEWGACKAHPPVLFEPEAAIDFDGDSAGLAGVFPATVGSDWCGEYQKNEESHVEPDR